jgi:peptidyl-prolyl cis-trans isomerase C
MRKVRYLAPILVLTALLAACGGGSSAAKLGNSDVAVVGSSHITNADFQGMIDQAKENYQASGQAFPKVGTTAYESLKSQAISLLVQQSERDQKAASMGVVVTDKQVQTQLTKLKQQYFKGNEKKYLAQLKKQHLTDSQVRRDIRSQLLQQALYTNITKGIKVSDSEIKSYYESHLSSYSQAESRGAQYLLIKSKTLVDSLYTQLKSANAATFCALVKKYSGDPSSKNSCGKATFTKGQTVPAFDKVLFSAPTGVLHAPIYDAKQYKSWFLIKPTTAVKAAKTTPLKSASTAIKATLLKQKQTDAVNAWSTDLEKSFCSGSKIQYQIGYTPSPDPCTSVNATTNQTTT